MKEQRHGQRSHIRMKKSSQGMNKDTKTKLCKYLPFQKTDHQNLLKGLYFQTFFKLTERLKPNIME